MWTKATITQILCVLFELMLFSQIKKQTSKVPVLALQKEHCFGTLTQNSSLAFTIIRLDLHASYPPQLHY